jgi:hypothetical protein
VLVRRTAIALLLVGLGSACSSASRVRSLGPTTTAPTTTTGVAPWEASVVKLPSSDWSQLDSLAQPEEHPGAAVPRRPPIRDLVDIAPCEDIARRFPRLVPAKLLDGRSDTVCFIERVPDNTGAALRTADFALDPVVDVGVLFNVEGTVLDRTFADVEASGLPRLSIEVGQDPWQDPGEWAERVLAESKAAGNDTTVLTDPFERVTVATTDLWVSRTSATRSRVVWNGSFGERTVVFFLEGVTKPSVLMTLAEQIITAQSAS